MCTNNAEAVTVLLAEDDAADQELARRAFNDGKICNNFLVVEDGEQAWAYLTRQGVYADTELFPMPQVLILDLNMPKITGMEVLKRIRKNPDLKMLPVIVMTTSDEERDRAQAYSNGANAYIKKPFDVDQYETAMRSFKEFWLQIVRLPPVSTWVS